jgi:hypothetical protein
MRMSPATRAKLTQQKLDAPEEISKAFVFFEKRETTQGLKILQTNGVYFSGKHYEDFFNYFKLFYKNEEYKLQALEILTCVPKNSITNNHDLHQLLHETNENVLMKDLCLLEKVLKIYRKSFSKDSKLMKKSLSFLCNCSKVKNTDIQNELHFIFDSYLSYYKNIEDILEFELVDYFIERYQKENSLVLEYLYLGNSKARNQIQSKIGNSIKGITQEKMKRFSYIQEVFQFSNQINYCNFKCAFPYDCIPLQWYIYII